jgi:hypothetical protein
MTKLKFNPTVQAKPERILKSDELYVRDALEGTLYSNTEQRRTVLRVVTQMMDKQFNRVMYQIVFWSDMLQSWMPLKVNDNYVLSTNTAMTLSLLRPAPTDVHDIAPVKKIERKEHRAALKVRRLEIAAAKRKGKTPLAATAVRQKKNIDPRTGIRAGTRKARIASILLSGKPVKIMRADLHALVAKFVQEKPNAQYKIVGLSAYTDWLVRWTCRSGRVKSDIFAPALATLGLNKKYARTK